jgi:hypothetical protein
MNATTPPTGGSPDDLDRRLGAFFRGEVPTPWPTLRAPVRTPAPVRGTGTLPAGRLALAASVAVLLVGGWLLSGRLPGPPTAGSLDNGTATVPMDLRPGDNHPMVPPGR